MKRYAAALPPRARELGMEPSFFQSNSEGALIDALHQAMDVYDGVVLNAGRTPITATPSGMPSRRFVSPLSKCICPISTPGRNSGIPPCWPRYARGQISGFGPVSYLLALQALAEEV